MFLFRSRLIKLAIICFTVVSAPVSANNFNYSYFQFHVGADPESLGVEYSFLLAENFHLLARFDSQFEHDGDLAGGIGFNGPVTDLIDIYGQAIAHYVNYTNTGSIRDDDMLLELNIGTRVWMLENLELFARLGVLDEHSIAHIGMRYHSTDQLSFGVGIINNGLWGPQMMLNVRAQF